MNKFIIYLSITILLLQSYAFKEVHAQSNREEIIDAALHYVLSTEITFASGMFFTIKHPQMHLGDKYLISGCIGLAAGFLKEFADELVRENAFEWADIGVDILGVGTGLLLHYLIIDKPKIKSKVSLNVSSTGYLATVKISF